MSALTSDRLVAKAIERRSNGSERIDFNLSGTVSRPPMDLTFLTDDSQFQDALLHFVRSRTRTLPDALDVLQDCWVALIKESDKLENRSHAEARLFQLARWRSVNHHKRWNRLPMLRMNDGESDEESLMENRIEAFDQYDVMSLKDALAQLQSEDDELYQVLFLRVFRDLKLAEIASIFELSSRTSIRRRLETALERLQQILGETA